MSIDPGAIAHAMTILEEQSAKADTIDHKLRIGRAISSLERLDEPLHSLPISDDVLIELFHSGAYNTWIAELFQVGVELVRHHRRRLAIAPQPRGGRPSLGRRVWFQQWVPELKARGYLQNWGVVKVRDTA